MSNTVIVGPASPAFLKVQFTGSNGAGAISIPGLEVGDVPFASPAGDSQLGLFESAVSVADELQQTTSEDLSSQNLTLYFIRW